MCQLGMQEPSEVNWISQFCSGYSEPLLRLHTTQITWELHSLKTWEELQLHKEKTSPLLCTAKIAWQNCQTSLSPLNIFFRASKQSWVQSRSPLISQEFPRQNMSLLPILPKCSLPFHQGIASTLFLSCCQPGFNTDFLLKFHSL